MWLLVPAFAGAYRSHRRRGAGKLFIAALCAACCATSARYWRDARPGSLWHRLDRGLAVALFASLLYHDRAAGMAGKRRWAFPVVVSLSYLGAQVLATANYCKANLVAHLSFRYLRYWWAVRSQSRCSLETVVLNSAAYWAHVAYVMHDDAQ